MIIILEFYLPLEASIFDPNFNSINNTDATRSPRIVQSRIIGFFTNLNFDYDKIVFLSLTGRKDWVSVLPDPFFILLLQPVLCLQTYLH